MKILRRVQMREDAARRAGLRVIDPESLKTESAVHGSGGVFPYHDAPRAGRRKPRKRRQS